jgi:hypothetical protein
MIFLVMTVFSVAGSEIMNVSRYSPHTRAAMSDFPYLWKPQAVPRFKTLATV